MAAQQWLDSFAAALARGDVAAAAELFEPEGYWRDLVAFTWTLHTSEGRAAIRETLARTLAGASPTTWQLTGESPARDGFLFRFTTRLGRGIGHLRLREGRAWTLLTALRELKGHEESAGPRRAHGVEPNWSERRAREANEYGAVRQPYVLIVGGGQGGIALGARLKRLGVTALIVEKNARAGDSWRKRYKSLCLHDPVWYDHLPYIPFPDHWPVFSPKDKIADWLEMYTRVMELDYWTSTECLNARPAHGGWEVDVMRNGTALTLRPTHLVLATGMSGFPYRPPVKGVASFQASGGLVLHSSEFRDGAAYAGKKCIVVGSSTSAHDIAADLQANSADVTMIQRAPSIVVRSQTLMDLAWGRLYSEEALARGITTDIADLTLASVPFRELPAMQRPIYEEIARRDADLYAGLSRAGFLHNMGEDGSGLHSIYLRRGAGYYIDVGASQMIIDARIKLRSAVNVAGLGDRSLLLSDGTSLPADLVVLATGYGNMNEWAARLISPEVAERIGPVWGLGSATKNDPGPWVGELRNMWKPTAQPNLWFHGGNLMQSRHYSLYLALQLKARSAGLGL